MASSNARTRSFSLADPYFLAGKAGASCALAIGIAYSLGNRDLVTASFVAVLCCSPGALMGLRTSVEQLVGSALGGVFGSSAAYFELPIEVGVPVAVTVTLLCTSTCGLSRGNMAAAFTALFVQIVTFGGPFETLASRLESVGIAGLSAFVINVSTSAFFYESLFRKRVVKVRRRVDTLLLAASHEGPAVLHPVFAVVEQLNSEMSQALRELAWRRNLVTLDKLRSLQAQVIWLRDYVHLIVDLELTADPKSEELLHFLTWLCDRSGQPPQLAGESAAVCERIVRHVRNATEQS